MTRLGNGPYVIERNVHSVAVGLKFEVIIDKDFHVVLLFCFVNLLFLALLCSFLVTFMSDSQPLSAQGNKCL